jgi:hypothetical protein
MMILRKLSVYFLATFLLISNAVALEINGKKNDDGSFELIYSFTAEETERLESSVENNESFDKKENMPEASGSEEANTQKIFGIGEGRKHYCIKCTAQNRGDETTIRAHNEIEAAARALRTCGGSFSLSKRKCR